MSKKLFCPQCGGKLTQWTEYDEDTGKSEEAFSCFKCEMVYSYQELKNKEKNNENSEVE